MALPENRPIREARLRRLPDGDRDKYRVTCGWHDASGVWCSAKLGYAQRQAFGRPDGRTPSALLDEPPLRPIGDGR